MQQAWDRRDGEPAEAYARFLTYRNLGPGRTLALAAQLHTGGSKRKKTLAGHWCGESSKHDWIERATAWDIDRLTKQGDELCRYWIGILVSVARKAAERLADPRCKPTTFAQCINVIEKLSPFLTPDVLKSLQPAAPPPPPAELELGDGEDRSVLPLQRAAVE